MKYSVLDHLTAEFGFGITICDGYNISNEKCNIAVYYNSV